ncbi:MAG: DUF2264 domain-containing protein [Schleiferilactobacillus harbinensis]|nr:DUF2264 domain-containing protein [Schleiferilactobacillus harbinensis]MCI1912001.1 DUF2264 domain-containing protein [Schleiferilactobacillus harbinensis]
MLTRQELSNWLDRLTPVDNRYVDTFGAAYDADIRQLEAVLRPLWGHLPAAAGAHLDFKDDPVIQRFYTFVQARQLPPVDKSRRQIIVETAAVSYFLGFYGKQLAADLGPTNMTYLTDWLNTMNDVPVPAGNWHFFIILLNIALRKQHFPYSADRLTDSLAKIDSFYVGKGWYTDGPTQQSDYYLAFAFHFYGLLYAQLVDDTHATTFIQRAQAFAADFIDWFDAQGRAIPFGRSLTYRFAPVGFWSQFYLSGAYAGTVFTPSMIKGLIDRSALYWKQRPITVTNGEAGPLSVGYGYQNYLLSEDYNAPGSPMWAFKLFGVLQLPADDPYWQLPAAPYPETEQPRRSNQVAGGMQFVLDPHAAHHVFLASRQFPVSSKLYHGQEKYGKFAYSSYFGFNLSRDTQGIEQFAVDNALALGIAGQDQFASRLTITASKMFAEYAVSVWHTATAQVVSYLVPLTTNLHVRIHEVTTNNTLDTYEGGFPLLRWNPKRMTPVITDHHTIVANQAGVSVIEDLLNKRQPTAVNQGPNTNIMDPEKNVVPALHAILKPGRHVLACAVLGDPTTGCTVDINTHLLVTATGYTLIRNGLEINMPFWQA